MITVVATCYVLMPLSCWKTPRIERAADRHLWWYAGRVAPKDLPRFRPDNGLALTSHGHSAVATLPKDAASIMCPRQVSRSDGLGERQDLSRSSRGQDPAVSRPLWSPLRWGHFP